MHQPLLYSPPSGVQGSSSEGLRALGKGGNSRTLRLQNWLFPVGNGSCVPKRLTHFWIRTCWELPARKRPARERRLSGALGRGKPLQGSRAFSLRFQWGDGVAVMFLKNNPYLLETCTQELVDQNYRISGFALKKLLGVGGQGKDTDKHLGPSLVTVELEFLVYRTLLY